MRQLGSELGRRLRALAGLKVVLNVVLGSGFWLGYGWLSRHPPLPVRSIPWTALDREMVRSPGVWGWVYLTPFLVTGLLPWLMDRRDLLRGYTRSFLALTLPAFVCFALHPVASPRQTLAQPDGPVDWIRWADGPYNAFPSLHAGFLVVMGGLAWRLAPPMPGLRAGRLVAIGLYVVWVVAVLYATLATGQHLVWDLVAGLALGVIADAWGWRGFNRSATGTPETPA